MFPNSIVFIDAGHGGLNRSGAYTTAPAKLFRHSKGSFHQGSTFYEGVWNRTLTNQVMRKLDLLGINYLPLHHEYLDNSLQQRVERVNWYSRKFQRSFVLSTHANAFEKHTARGFEIYTSPGITESDRIAEMHWNHVNALRNFYEKGKEVIMRTNPSGSTYDKEANFFILRQTIVPAILVEHLFFDNFDDAILLMDDNIIDLFAEAQVRTIMDYFSA
jgi:N-acetylmuramoyl-L-alanine amidase